MDPGALDEGTLRRLIQVGRSLVVRLDLEGILESVLTAARDLTGARFAALGILNERKTELERFLTLGVDDGIHLKIGDLPRGRGVLGALIRSPEPLRLDDVSEHASSLGFPPGHPPMRSFLGVPIKVRDEAWGNLYLTEKERAAFDQQDEEAAVLLADWAAIAIENARLYEGLALTAVETAKSVERERLRHRLEAAEQERKRWARELHDETLQALGGLRMLHSAALRGEASAEDLRRVIEQGMELIDVEIDNLSSLIVELRPAALDQIGLAPALRTLADRRSQASEIEIDVLVRLGEEDDRLAPELESMIYRLVQEGLNNVAKHARASRAEAVVEQAEGFVRVKVEDDGCGFDPDAVSGGFGLIGMRERVELAGGELEIESAPGSGTTIKALIPGRVVSPEPDQRSSRPLSRT